jgi:DNA modification methylase
MIQVLQGDCLQVIRQLELMQALIRIVEPGETILEPFAGSGSTLEAAALEGYSVVGIEIMAANVEIIRRRLADYGYGQRSLKERAAARANGSVGLEEKSPAVP